MSTAPLLIVGASARAAAFSALRAGLEPRCADLFADADLRARVPVERVPAATYPGCLRQAAVAAPAGPWMYTGGLENHPALVDEIARLRPLWGNAGEALAACRAPDRVERILNAAGVPCPAVAYPDRPPNVGRWLVKPVAGAGGRGVREWVPGSPGRGDGTYLQELIEGAPCAAIFVAVGGEAVFLGATHQLVGEPWLHAGRFHYCGSVGPLILLRPTVQAFERLGRALAAGCGLRGLFGVDCILRDGVPWPVEVNPRYTASVEVLEHATGLSALAWHRRAFEPSAPEPVASERSPATGVVGKAVLFASSSATFPEEGPWQEALSGPRAADELPTFADIPDAAEPVKARRPVVTFFARAASPAACRDELRRVARDLDRRIFGK